MLDFNYALQLAGRNTDMNEYILSLYNIVVQRNYKVVVELGAGQSTYALTAAVNATKGQFYSVDVTSVAPLRGFEQGEGVLEKEPRYHQIVLDDMDLVKKWDKEIDFLFIDSSHLYKHTLDELNSWPKFVKKGGIIMMHDTAHQSGIQMECRQALNEWLKTNGDDYGVVHLLDTKIAGMSILLKL